MADLNRRFLLHERPTGRIGPNTFELSEQPIPDIGDGEALVRVDWIWLGPPIGRGSTTLRRTCPRWVSAR